MITTSNKINHDVIGRLGEFLSRYYEDTIATALQDGKRSITVEYSDLYQFDSDLAKDYIDSPDVMVSQLDRATTEVTMPNPDAESALAKMNVRVSGVDEVDLPVSGLRDKHRGQYLGVQGQVSMATQVQPRVVEAVFRCERCSTEGSDFYLDPIPQTGEELQLPGECPGCKRKGPYTLDESKSVMVDHQIVELTDEPGEHIGANANSIPVHLYRDAAGEVMPGDRVRVNGQVTTDLAQIRSQSKISTRRPWKVEGRAVDAEQVAFSEVTPERLDEIKRLSKQDDLVSLFVDSIAPNILTEARGDTHKLALVLQLFGGVDRDGRKGDINVFLVGEKGTGKSQMLSRVSDLAPKSVEASGKGATAAGLTATATQSDHSDGWMLDAGALVLASGGLAAIDEFDKMSDGARKSMHEAMEQQRIPVNKAGINTVLPAKTAILAAANPMGGNYDRYTALYDQINLEAPLISRFDLIFALTAPVDAERDAEIAAHQLSSEETSQPIDDELITEYVAYARQHVDPVIPEGGDVEQRLVEYYVDLREKTEQDDGSSTFGPRTNDALRRLAEASARMRLDDTVRMEDAERAIELKQMHIGDTGVTEDGDIDGNKMGGYGENESIRGRIKDALDTDTWAFTSDISAETGIAEAKVRDVLERAREGKISLPVEEDNGKWRIN
jgi:replicative DNA helicase Mcm